MNTLQPAGADSPTLWQHSMHGSERLELERTIGLMMKEAERGLDSRTILLPRSDCERVLAMIEARQRTFCREAEAIVCAKTLLGMYPARAVHDPETYSHALKTVFMHAELDFAKRVVDPVHGLPSRLRHLPTIAEVTEALEAERRRRSSIRGTAAWMIRRHDELAKGDDAWNLTPEQLEARRRQVAELLSARREEDPL